jgi:hypothetical protein
LRSTAVFLFGHEETKKPSSFRISPATLPADLSEAMVPVTQIERWMNKAGMRIKFQSMQD